VRSDEAADGSGWLARKVLSSDKVGIAPRPSSTRQDSAAVAFAAYGIGKWMIVGQRGDQRTVEDIARPEGADDLDREGWHLGQRPGPLRKPGPCR